MIAFFILCSISAASAGMTLSGDQVIITNGNGNTTDNMSNTYAGLSANKGVYSIEKNKIPYKLKKYENSTFQVVKNKYIKYKGTLTDAVTTKSISYIDFGDGTKKKSSTWINHKYKKAGWYKITVTFNASFTNLTIAGLSTNLKGKIYNSTKTFLVKVTDAPQLSLTTSPSISAGYYTKKNFKKGNIDYLVIKVANLGSKTSKASKITMWYQKPGSSNFGKVYSKLKKYTTSAYIK
ncbi:MAG: hypothetical protein VB038_08100 [Methanobrevibacter sp.]|nr:hypothetical protein [Methanobrevibacter sp.]MEA4957675.1 hypothetical protein [Methanobrevibacter sp.]